ncbi:hypothetical protein LR48_Vigan09g050200 [Vigna angularis]|uniref:Uncharacterized protein n=1 Tax=Phaseolus angularis TaxID=3914 RepID=A0A0L9VA12_PHAAN|nr:hypothetical protein LR48_Vigan09g050200 [Vigna angularis]
MNRLIGSNSRLNGGKGLDQSKGGFSWWKSKTNGDNDRKSQNDEETLGLDVEARKDDLSRENGMRDVVLRGRIAGGVLAADACQMWQWRLSVEMKEKHREV